MGSPVIFLLLALVAVASALGMLLSRNAIYSALFLVLNFATIAVLYLVLNAPFIAMVQITVYAGAIMVLFLFVIMLLGAERTGATTMRRREWEWALSTLLGATLIIVFAATFILGPADAGGSSAGFVDTSPAQLGLRLFEGYVLPFELTGLLLLTSMIGVVVLGRARKAPKTPEGESDA